MRPFHLLPPEHHPDPERHPGAGQQRVEASLADERGEIIRGRSNSKQWQRSSRGRIRWRGRQLLYRFC